MVPAPDTQAPPARAPVKPRKLTITDAVDQWERTTRAIEGLTILRDEAKEVILENARRTGKRTYKDRVAVVQTGGSLTLDQPKVKTFLGDRLAEFQTRTKLGLALKLLK